MSGVFTDPRFPDRPDHPDFWRLVNSVTYLDGEVTEGQASLEEVLAKFIDPGSALYMGHQRTLRALVSVPREDLEEKDPELAYANLVALVLAVWMDGFCIAYRAAKEES